jgi:hypothetical protein
MIDFLQNQDTTIVGMMACIPAQKVVKVTPPPPSSPPCLHHSIHRHLDHLLSQESTADAADTTDIIDSANKAAAAGVPATSQLPSISVCLLLLSRWKGVVTGHDSVQSSPLFRPLLLLNLPFLG